MQTFSATGIKFFDIVRCFLIHIFSKCGSILRQGSHSESQIDFPSKVIESGLCGSRCRWASPMDSNAGEGDVVGRGRDSIFHLPGEVLCDCVVWLCAVNVNPSGRWGRQNVPILNICTVLAQKSLQTIERNDQKGNQSAEGTCRFLIPFPPPGWLDRISPHRNTSRNFGWE